MVMRPCVGMHALGTVALAVLLHAQADLHRTSDDGSIKRPVEAPLRMRLFNPRAGDPRRRVGDLLTPEDLELKVSVAQAVQGKNMAATKADYAFVGYMPQKGYMGTMWRKAKGETNLFDPFRRGEIVALRRGEILGVMSKRPALCERKNSWRPKCECGARSPGSGVGAGPSANADCLHTQCIRRIRWCPPNRHSDPARSCPVDQSCKTWNDLHEDGCEYTMAADQNVLEKNCRGALSGRAMDRAEVVHRSVLHYVSMCDGVDSTMGWKYNWCTTVARYWKKNYVFPLKFNKVLQQNIPTFNASDSHPNPWDPTREKLVCVGDPAKGTNDATCATFTTYFPSQAQCTSAGCAVVKESVTCKKAFEKDSCSDGALNTAESCNSHGSQTCAWDGEKSRCGYATWRALCKFDDNQRKVGNVDPMTEHDELEPEIDAPVCVGKPELLCLPTTPVGIQFGKGACLPSHCAPWLMGSQEQGFNVSLVEPFMPTRYSEREKEGPAPDRYSDEDRQQAGTMEIPGAGVDYNRPDIVHEIRYGELDSYNANTGMFTVIVEKKYNKVSGNFQFGEEQREQSPGQGYPDTPSAAGSPYKRKCPPPGDTSADTDWICEQVPAKRIFQIWAPPNQAALQPNAQLDDLPGVSEYGISSKGYEDGATYIGVTNPKRHGRVSLFDATHDEVHHVDSVADLLAKAALTKGRYEDQRQHIILAPGTYWLKKPLEFVSSRVHISGYQEYSKLIRPVRAKASSTYSQYNKVENLITDEGLTTTRASLEQRRRDRARGIGLVTRGEGHDRTSVHDNQRSAGTMWQSDYETVVNQWLEFDLGQDYNLTHLFIWNMNQDKVALSRSIKHVRILTSVSNVSSARKVVLGEDGFPMVNSREWKALTPHCEYWDRGECPNPCAGCEGFVPETFTLNPGKGEPEMPAQEIKLFGEHTENVRYVRFEVRSAWGGGMIQFIGLSEVRFGGRTTYELRPRIVAGHNGPITKIKPMFAVKFSDVILRHGVTDGSGGIVNDGTLIMYNTTLESNVSYAWDGASWRSGGVAVYNRGNAFLDLCDLVWDFTGTTTPSGHAPHLGKKASQGKTSFIGLLARRIGLFKATGGMLYNYNPNEDHPDHLHKPAEKGGNCGQIDCSKKIPPSDNTLGPAKDQKARRAALMSIDGCKFEGSNLSPRKWDDLGEATPWWCNFDPAQRMLKRLKNALTTGVLDGSEGPPFGSHTNVGGGMERGGAPTAGDLQGGVPKAGATYQYEYGDAVRKHKIDGTVLKDGVPWDYTLNADFRFDIGGHWDVSDLRICRVVDADSIVLCDEDGEELAIRLTGIGIPTAESCQNYFSDITEKAFTPAVLRCSGAVMKKRAQLGAIWLANLIGTLVKVELTQRYMPFGENVGRVTLIEGDYKSVSVSEELLRLGFVVRLTPVIL